uniref:C-type lectin domain-containing protein n=1 Tax=Panagrolaimus davidi TaxID=227884 RepID=A0A914Q3L3_9BILA
MFKLILFFITFVISLPLNIPKLTKNLKSKVCPWGIESSVFGDNRCYIFHEFPLNYYNSEEFCEGYGATLATVSNGDINQFISETTKSTFDPDGEKSYWLGAQNLVTPNQWKWVDGSLLNGFENWNSGEPINATEERCLSGKVGSGKWFASICYSEKPAVCVYPKVSGQMHF